MKTHNTKRILSADKRKCWGFSAVKGGESYHRVSIYSIYYPSAIRDTASPTVSGSEPPGHAVCNGLGPSVIGSSRLTESGSYQLDKDDGVCKKRPPYGVHFEPDEELTLLLPYYKEGCMP